MIRSAIAGNTELAGLVNRQIIYISLGFGRHYYYRNDRLPLLVIDHTIDIYWHIPTFIDCIYVIGTDNFWL